jgi:BirA family biotin operon repressor/biotin-[acetyl-CoA-carboxylase] ligase
MPSFPFSNRFLSMSLPDKPVETGCFALEKGLGEHAAPFSPDTLFGTGALLGPVMPESDEAAETFFRVPAPVYFCDEVTSTFAVGHVLAQNGVLPEWGAVLAACQTAGRGQFRRHWQSPRGNLYVTFRLPSAPLFHTSAAAIVTGLLLAAAFYRLGCPLKLKWPNDLLSQGQAKAAGILLEKRNGVLLAGLGVNLRAFPDEQQLRRERAVPAGLLQTGDGNLFPLAPFPLWQALVNETISMYSQLVIQSAEKMLPDLADLFLAWKGEAVTVSDADGTALSGKLRGVSSAGGLLLQTSDGSIHERFSGSLVRT